MAVATILLLGLVTYGGISLVSKMNKVDELNGKIAEVDGSWEEKSSTQPSPSDTTDSTDDSGELSEQPSEITNPSSSQKPQTGEKTQHDKPGTTPGNTVTSPQMTPKPSSPDNSGGTGTKPTSPPSSNDKDKKKKEVDSATTAEMEKLRASCTATSNNLVSKIVQELKADEDASLESIQGDFLTDILAAEAKCDVQFNLLIGLAQAQYKAAGIDEQSLPDWSSEYESAKSQARSSALTAITKALK